MNNYKFIALALAFFCLQAYPALAIEEKRWHDHKDRGWFFYEPKPLIEEEETEDFPSAAATASFPKPDHLIIREEGERLLGKAMVYPTEENVKNYMEHNKKMIEAASHFGRVWERVLANNPHLLQKRAYAEDTAIDREEAIKELAGTAGLFYFYQADTNCTKQHKYILRMKERYGFEVIAISLDGSVAPELLSSTRMDNGISVRLGVQEVPALFLAFPDQNKTVPVFQGELMPASSIERRLFQYARLQKSPSGYFGDVLGVNNPFGTQAGPLQPIGHVSGDGF